MKIKLLQRLRSFSIPQKKPLPTPPEVWQDPIYFIGFGLGSGAIPIAPGTFGTLFAIPFYLLIATLPLFWYVIVVVLFILFSSYICDRLSKKIKLHDHPGMCLDEFAGFFVTMINAPFGWQWILLGFVLFRIFDIVKPWPINWLDEKIHGGFGMVIDDVVAGLFACVIIQIAKILFIT